MKVRGPQEVNSIIIDCGIIERFLEKTENRSFHRKRPLACHGWSGASHCQALAASPNTIPMTQLTDDDIIAAIERRYHRYHTLHAVDCDECGETGKNYKFD